MWDAAVEDGDLAAAKMVLERALGRPTEHVINGDEAPTLDDVDSISPEAIDAELERLNREFGRL